MEICQSATPSLRKDALKKLASKSVLAGRIDLLRRDLTGETGRAYRDEILKKIAKRQDLSPAKQPKPLPVPDSNPKKNRGGRRYRKRKERYSTTDMSKLVNRMQFGIPEESSLGDGLGFGYGMLGQDGNGKLPAKIAKKFKETKHSAGSSGATTSGFTSSLAFTSVQELELPNPQLHAYNQLRSGTQSTYFSELGTFSKIKAV
ncbi:hypothetical protein GIB67_020024 [Kingdonia uniflora]|uniref:Nop domain-containing protein n=1 Tax=Kingdonia uniflora TaxID=39325 RepID=A0A7J7N4Y3_9MAGN|nr:hypothetical protein GIB67_020024 [Kingdonia uniflora]